VASHRLQIAREQYKFSCAHMTVFPDGTKERLHGHNYQLGVAIEVADVGLQHMIPFSSIKLALTELCAAWKERVLIAEANPHLRVIKQDATEVELRLCGDRYVFPAADALFLPIDNISVEALAAHAASLIHARLADVLAAAHVRALEVSCEESPGQGATCTIALR
jgi:6-pyruvoyltetrahydropterin/6-carboxytetrahydropterin synthase